MNLFATTIIATTLSLAWDSKIPQASPILASAIQQNIQTLETHTPLCKKKPDHVFWSRLFVAVSKYESNWNTDTTFYECNKRSCVYKSGCIKDKSKGYCMTGGHKADNGYVISRGLFQISYGSALSYGCDLSSPQDLHDMEKNINCAVKIMTKQIANNKDAINGRIYWSVLRKTNDKRSLILKQACED